MRRRIGEERDHFLRAEVVAVRTLTPHMIRVRLGGRALSRFVPSPHGDERIRIAFPATAHAEPPVPTLADGMWGYHDPADRDRVRSYTVRRWDAESCEMEVDFVVHDGGVAAAWAGMARPGDAVTVTASDGWYAPSAGSGWQLLVADMTGLPALERIVEELPPGAEVHVIVEVIDPDDIRRLPDGAVASQRWIVGAGHGIAPSALAEEVAAFEPPAGSRGYVWFGGEAAASRAVRAHARNAWGLGLQDFDIIGYWTFQKERWQQRFRAIAPEMAEVRAELAARARSTSELLTLYDEALQERGL